jgi:hypothetical protein
LAGASPGSLLQVFEAGFCKDFANENYSLNTSGGILLLATNLNEK